MSVYAIGDIQGCYQELRQLLDKLEFDPQKDQLWFVGDLVNRGPDSLAVLRFVQGLGEAAVSVLGNHDLHLLALALGEGRDKNPGSLQAILDAPDRDSLLHWLRHRPLLHIDEQQGFAMLHAGLPPQWDMRTAIDCATEVEQVLRSEQHPQFFAHMYGDKPRKWDPELQGMERLRFISNCFTRLRYCTHKGKLALEEKGPPGTQKKGRLPWFLHPQRKSRGQKLLFGHWSTLGYRHADGCWALDSGCLWGGRLTALRLHPESPQAIHLPCKRQQDPRRFR